MGGRALRIYSLIMDKSRRIPLEHRRHLKYDSQRSGFTYFKRELIRDDGWWVHPSEWDEPAPHNKYIGGEGDADTGEMRNSRKDYPSTQTEVWSP